MTQLPLSVTIITLNEEANIERALASVRWAADVVVVDSGSTDKTRELAEKMGARVFTNPWKGYGQQKNFAQAQTLQEWVLNIDADEEVSTELQSEIESILNSPTPHSGYQIPRKTFYLGQWIR